MLRILRTPLMCRATLMVLALGVLLSAGALASVRPGPAVKPQRMSDKSGHSRPAASAGKHRAAPHRRARLTGRNHLRAGFGRPIRERRVLTASTPEAISLDHGDLGLASPLRGSRASLERQDEIAEGEDGLERIQDEDDLRDRIAHNFLVPVPTSGELTINQNLPETHRYCRPWTAQFLADLARLHAERFHSSLEVSSAVRTVEYQKQLERINGNAAAAEGDIASPHLTGATVDVAKANMTREEIAWMRSSLLALEQAGKLDVEEEFKQACFHITVYKSYVGATPGFTGPLEARRPADASPPSGAEMASTAGQAGAAPAAAAASARARARLRHSRRAAARPAKALPA